MIIKFKDIERYIFYKLLKEEIRKHSPSVNVLAEYTQNYKLFKSRKKELADFLSKNLGSKVPETLCLKEYLVVQMLELNFCSLPIEEKILQAFLLENERKVHDLVKHIEKLSSAETIFYLKSKDGRIEPMDRNCKKFLLDMFLLSMFLFTAGVRDLQD